MQANGTDPRAARAFIATAVAVGVAFVLQVEWLESAREQFVCFSALAVALGFVAWVYANPSLRGDAEGQGPPRATAAAEAVTDVRPARSSPSPCVVLLIASIVVLTGAIILLYLDLRSTAGGWLWLAGILGVLLSVWLLERTPAEVGAAETSQRRKRAAAIAAIVLLALALRTFRLEQIPAELVDDEALIAEWGMSIVHGTPIWDGSAAARTTIFRKGGAAEPLLGCAIHAAVMQVAGETTFGLRLTAALAGAIGVGLLYLVLRELVRPGAALAASFLLAFCHTHLYWTRSGMTQALVTMAATGVILFTLRGLRSRGYLPWLIAGALLGLAQHLYEGGRFLVPILALFFLVLTFTERGFVRRHFRHVGAMALMSAAVFAPLAFWYLREPDALLAITRGAFIFEQPEYLASRYPGMSTWQIVLAELHKSLEGFTVHGDGGAFYPIWVPLFDPVVRALVLAGIAGFTLTLRPPYMLVSLWLWVPILIACTVTVDPPPMTRLMLAVPALFAVVGTMIERLGRLVERGYGEGGAAVARVVGVLLLAGAALRNTDIFFVRYPAVFPINVQTASAEAAAEAGEAYKVYFVGSSSLPSNPPTVRFLARGVAREDLEPDAIPVQELGWRGAVFLVSTETPEALDGLRAAYPGGEMQQRLGPDGNLLFTSYRVESGELQRAVGADATWRDSDLRFGWEGENEGELADPRGLAVDANGSVYVANSGNRRIDVFDAAGRFQHVLGEKKAGKAGVGEVCSLAFDGDGLLLALDRHSRWIKRLDAKGEIAGRLGGPRMFDHPVGIAVAPDGTILAVDAARPALVRLSATGGELARTGEPGSGPGQFIDPVAVAVAADGRVYVADYGNARVQRFSPALEYEIEWEIPHAEQETGQILAVTNDDAGAVYVADPEQHRVLRFSPDGEKQWNVGGEGTPPVGLGWPMAVAVNAAGDLYVLDGERASVYRFDLSRR